MCDRWTRLERYARCKQQRFPIDKLPPDVFAIVFAHLEHNDMSALVQALNGTCPVIRSPCDIIAIPEEVRTRWLRVTAYNVFDAQLRAMASETCFYADHLQFSIHALADWSPFRMCNCRMPPTPIAEYGWQRSFRGHPSWCAHVNTDALRNHVDDMVKRCMCATRVTMHAVIHVDNGTSLFVSEELTASVVLVFPHFVDLLPMARAPNPQRPSSDGPRTMPIAPYIL